mmetsp:Transcript_12017/g.35969  ORF Transcript_12017/g.35969 Transcript_12017/m.35969 type:complete len:211 (+) Transcript_12017:196-828(+)
MRPQLPGCSWPDGGLVARPRRASAPDAVAGKIRCKGGLAAPGHTAGGVALRRVRGRRRVVGGLSAACRAACTWGRLGRGCWNARWPRWGPCAPGALRNWARSWSRGLVGPGALAGRWLPALAAWGGALAGIGPAAAAPGVRACGWCGAGRRRRCLTAAHGHHGERSPTAGCELLRECNRGGCRDAAARRALLHWAPELRLAAIGGPLLVL